MYLFHLNEVQSPGFEGIGNREEKIGNRELLIGNRELLIGNREYGIRVRTLYVPH
jgi:hypothetical protein